MSDVVRPFGPFTNIPVDAISLAGFVCKFCRKPVERFAQAMPNLAPRLIFHACRCGTLVTWEDELCPSSRTWKANVKLMRRCGVQVVVFNGGRELRPDFSGAN